MKLITTSTVLEPTGNNEPKYEPTGDNYSPRQVAAKMLMKKDRKIPGSVFKPHSEEVILL